jgi:hypothetical protein
MGVTILSLYDSIYQQNLKNRQILPHNISLLHEMLRYS